MSTGEVLIFEITWDIVSVWAARSFDQTALRPSVILKESVKIDVKST